MVLQPGPGRWMTVIMIISVVCSDRFLPFRSSPSVHLKSPLPVSRCDGSLQTIWFPLVLRMLEPE